MSAHAQSRPQPLLIRAHVVGAIAGLITALVMFGVLPAALGDQLKSAVEVIYGAVATIVAVLSPIVHALVSRKIVTPLSDPRTNSGLKLVPTVPEDPTADVLVVPVDASQALARANEIAPVEADQDVVDETPAA